MLLAWQMLASVDGLEPLGHALSSVGDNFDELGQHRFQKQDLTGVVVRIDSDAVVVAIDQIEPIEVRGGAETFHQF